MKDELITYETAVLAKEKGFNEYCDHSFIGTPPDLIRDSNHRNSDYKTRSSVPTQALLQRWLREEHNIHIYVTPLTIEHYNVTYFKGSGYRIIKEFHKSYEEALEVGLIKTLNLI